MSINGVELKEGQTWLTRNGTKGVIKKRKETHEVYHWLLVEDDGSQEVYTDDGKFDYYYDTASIYDLVELVGDSTDKSMSYSLEEIDKACSSLGWSDICVMRIIDKLQELKDPEYTEYLRLKTKFQK